MCATVLAPQVTMTTPFVGAARYQDTNFRRGEHTEDRKRQLSMRWVVVSDEHGNRRLRMRWTVARSWVPPTLCNVAPQCVQPAVGRVCDPTPGTQERVAILNWSRQGT